MILEAAELALGYPGRVVARGLDFAVGAGETLAVLGHNGAGKTTLVKTLLGVLQPAAGALRWPQERPKEIGYLAQLADFDRRFPIRVRDLAAMGAWRGLGFRQGIDAAARARIDAAMAATGVADIADAPLHALSGGQLQRALFARVIVQDAPLILLDEPFAAVDQRTEAALLSLIARWRDEDRAVVLVLHDLSTVLDHCSHALLLGRGRGVFGSVDETLTPEALVGFDYLSPSQAAWLLRAPRTSTTSDADHV